MGVSWLDALDGDYAPADRDRLEAWTERLGPPVDPELLGSVAVFARDAGADGHPASRLVRLFDALQTRAGPEVARRLRDVALDAHGLGLLDRRRQQAEASQKKSTPVLLLQEGVLACLAGPTSAAVLDGVLARTFRAAVGASARWVVIDVSHATLQPDLLARTLADLDRVGLPDSIQIGVSGVESPEALAAQVVRFGGVKSVRTAGRLGDLLADLRRHTVVAPIPPD